MNNTQINYTKIIQIISDEIRDVLSEIYNASDNELSLEIKKQLGNVNVYIDDEQSYVKRTQTDTNGIYINVCFSDAPVNFGNSVVPITLKVLGTANKIQPTQLFMAAFASRWNAADFGDGSSTQIWVAPRVNSNFNEVSNEFRDLFSVSGTVIIGQNTVKLKTLIYKYGDGANEEEEIKFLSWQNIFNNSPSPQPFGDKAGFAVTETNFATSSFTINTYMMGTRLVEDCLKIKGFRKWIDRQTPSGGPYREPSTLNTNSTLKIFMKYSNGYTNRPAPLETSNANDPVMGKDFLCKYKVVSISEGQNLGDIPTITIGFSL